MTDRGYIALARGFFEHPIFAQEPFTEREAFLWMIQEAAYGTRRVRRGKEMIELERGQFAHSLRFMATAWKWKSEARVRRFLERLKTDAMIEIKSTRDATHINICNYDKFQGRRSTERRASDAPTDARATQTRTKEPITKEDNNNTPAREAEPTAFDELAKVLDAERAQAVIDHRRKLRKPLTPHAAKLLAGKFGRCRDPVLAADTMIANGWQGIEPEWMENRENRNGNGNQQGSRRANHRAGAREDAFLAGMARAANRGHGDDQISGATGDKIPPGRIELDLTGT